MIKVMGRKAVWPANNPPSGVIMACRKETSMNEDDLNISIRKFLKMVGVGSQREIEQSVARAVHAAAISGTESFPVHMTLEIAGLGLKVQFDGEIHLDASQRTP
ncbi:MAG: hypothetical protein NVS2B4_18170 [Ramlibacter sp.]